MNEKKLCSAKVPQKFAEWLLTMGCSFDKVPSVDKLAEMCRGQYYMVWRSTIEHVEPKDSIRNKRLQVFIDDVQKCHKNNAFKPDPRTVLPEEVSQWNQETELVQRLEDAEARLALEKKECNQIANKVSSKLSQKNLARVRLENAQRRAWLLQQVADELSNKKTILQDTRSIANSLCYIETTQSNDIESKLDKCTSGRRQVRRASVSTNSITSSSTEQNDSEEYNLLIQCRGDALWPQLINRRAKLISALNITNSDCNTEYKGPTLRAVLSHTASLQLSLSLDALKNQAHVRHTSARLRKEVDCTISESCELLVMRAESARENARVSSLRELLDDVTARRGAFAIATVATASTNNTKQINFIEKSIESKRDELRRVITSLFVTERKTQNVRECLIKVFNSFHSDRCSEDSIDRFGSQISMPQESISTLRRFYEERREKTKNKLELSLDFDAEENCSYGETDNQNPKFIDELNVYLKIFDLENNRKLILDSGKKIWTFETIQASINRLGARLQDNEQSCPVLCPSVSLTNNLQRLVQMVQRGKELSDELRQMQSRQIRNIAIDITSQIEEEQITADKVKKRINENILNLQKTIKTLSLGQENLKLWSDNQMRKFISIKRTVEGRTYRDLESYYVENLNLNI